MPTLTYAYLGDAVQVGEPLGCDSTGWPYRVENVEHTDGDSATCVTVEPWPIPGPLADETEKLYYSAAMAHARDRQSGRIQVGAP